MKSEALLARLREIEAMMGRPGFWDLKEAVALSAEHTRLDREAQRRGLMRP